MEEVGQRSPTQDGADGIGHERPDAEHRELVADDGTGLPSEATERIFERFYRADESRSGGGAGLGLAIAAWIVREHAGTIVAANNDQGGATFSVDLPAADLPGHR